MGNNMPKFVTDSYTTVKETYYSFKNGVQEIKETFEVAKTAFKVARSLEKSKFAATKDPKDFLDEISYEPNIPESYKSLLKRIPEDTLKTVTKLLLESLSKSQRPSEVQETSAGPSSWGEQQSSVYTRPDLPEFPSQEASEAIGRMTDDIPEDTPSNPSEGDSTTPPSQSGYIDLDPPTNINYNPGYSEMKPDDGRETQFSPNINSFEKTEWKVDNRPFGMENSNNYHRPTSLHEEQPSCNQEDTSSTESRYYRPHDGNQSGNFSEQNYSASPYEEPKEDLPPMTKRLGEEFQKKFGPNWKQRVPSFLHHPEIQESLPDLGLGLSKENNQDMVMAMSRVLNKLM